MSREPEVKVTYFPVYGEDGVTVRDLRVTVDDRPLVVIDPDDRDQQDPLRDAIRNRGGGMVPGEIMQAALRSLIEASKPEEPTNPKARVSDRRENIWRLLADGDWVCTSGPDVGEYLVWWQLTERGPLSVQVTP